MNKSLKEYVQQHANRVCEYCRAQAQFSPSPFSVEHIIPLAKSGSDDTTNLAFASQGCNNVKFTAASCKCHFEKVAIIIMPTLWRAMRIESHLRHNGKYFYDRCSPIRTSILPYRRFMK
ncbi:MAG: HNH endonuclease [Lewinellaceae bacterium]|nr:HNH endonuclease [Lewinellaceae bacterium]